MSATRILPQSARILARRSTLRPNAKPRSFATASEPPKAGADASHLAAGLGGGAVVLLGIYGYYHYSGTAQVVSTARDTINTATSAKDKLLASSPSPKQVLDLLRSFSKTYVAAIPGAGFALDQAFEKLEDLAETHGEQVAEIANKTYKDLLTAAKDGKSGGEKVLKTLEESVKKIQALAGEEGGELLDKLFEKSPELKKVVGGGSGELQKLAEKHGPKARKIAEDAYDQASKIVSDGGLNAKTYEAVKTLIDQKTKEITALAKDSGSDAWAASAKAAGPLLEKMPDVQKLVEEQVGSLEGVAGEENIKAVKDLYAALDKIGKSGKSTEEMTKDAKKLVESKVGSFKDLKSKAKEAGDKAKDLAGESGSSLASYATAIPGLGGLAKIFEGNDLKNLKELAEKHGEDAEKILASTYDEIKEILRRKVGEAKKVAEYAEKDAKKEVQK